MLDRDRTFLTDFVQFGYMHHVVVAQSLYEVWRHPDAAAARKRAAVDRLDMTAAAQMAEELNDAVRMQRIAAARMYSQMAASIEDFGALCSAVRNRRMENAGAFKRYLYGEPSEVGSFFDFVREQPNGDLRTYLKFPSLQGLKHRLEAADYQAFVHDYSSLADTIRTTADMWRTVAQPSAMSQALAPGWENDVNIILDIIDPGQPPSQVSQSLMNAAHNKIKHWLTAVDDLSAFVGLADAQTIVYARHSLEHDAVERTYRATESVALSTAEVGAAVLKLGDLDPRF